VLGEVEYLLPKDKIGKANEMSLSTLNGPPPPPNRNKEWLRKKNAFHFVVKGMRLSINSVR